MYMFTDNVMEAVRDNGMRGLIGYGLVDFDGSGKDLEIGVDLAKRWNRTCNDRIRVSIAPHAEYTSTPKMIEAAARAAIDMQLPFHIHVSETKAEHEGCITRRGLDPNGISGKPWRVGSECDRRTLCMAQRRGY